MRPSLFLLLVAVVFASVASAAPVLTRGLTNIRAEFNAAFPNRDKSSDGWIGDTAHQSSKSGHNPDISGTPEYRDGDSKDEVRAIDVTANLRAANGATMEKVVQYLLTRARAGTYMPIRYMIYNSRIWEKENNWNQRAYTGSNPHTSHLHISGDYGTAARTEQADEWKGTLGLASVAGGNPAPAPAPAPAPVPAPGLPSYANGSRVNSKTTNNIGTDVRTLQRFIGSDCGTADGVFGTNTESCVKWYQGIRGLVQDGIAGPKTWAPILQALGRRLRANE